MLGTCPPSPTPLPFLLPCFPPAAVKPGEPGSLSHSWYPEPAANVPGEGLTTGVTIKSCFPVIAPLTVLARMGSPFQLPVPLEAGDGSQAGTLSSCLPSYLLGNSLGSRLPAPFHTWTIPSCPPVSQEEGPASFLTQDQPLHACYSNHI